MSDIAHLLTNESPKAEDDVLIPNDPSCVFQGARLRNASNIAVQSWQWGVLFRDDNEPYIRNGGGITPGQEDFQSTNIQRCAFRKVCGAVMANGGIINPVVAQVPVDKCYSIVGWIIYPKTTSLGEVEFVLLPDNGP